ncbi:MAG: hypothetical protein WC469_02325 [Candidatus Omnitrophota bacterium]
MKTQIRGLATGIGSLPYQEADKALDIIFRYLPEIPFWPQLPRRDIREGMTMQFSEGMPCLKATRQGLIYDPADREKELEDFYGRIISGDLDYFGISPDFSSGFARFISRLRGSDLKGVELLKCHISGPFTFAAGIKDEKGIALLYDEIMMQAILKGLSFKALWQLRALEVFGKKMILFIDEPYLGCFGSAYTPINRDTVINGLKELTEAVKSDKVLVGAHCCGNTDWSIFTEIPGLDIISFDAFNFLERFILYAGDIESFLERDGILCWGIVPTGDAPLKENARALAERLKRGIEAMTAKGVKKDLLLENLLLSPSCGLGTLAGSRVEPIFELLGGISGILRKCLNFFI